MSGTKRLIVVAVRRGTRRQSKRVAPEHPADALAAWTGKRLKVPAGHAKEGQPLELPQFAVDFFREVLQPEIHTGWLLLPRKQGKSYNGNREVSEDAAHRTLMEPFVSYEAG